MKKLRSPQEKKLLSYKKDCRNTYGERGSHSRHAIAANRSFHHRAYRHQINQILDSNKIQHADVLEEVNVEVKSILKSDWCKSPDQPLGEVIQRKLKERYAKGINASVKKTLISKD